MSEISEMRKYIEAFAAFYSMNLSQLSERLGYRSKTSLIRMMDEPVRPKSAQDFRKRLLANFQLSPKQIEELDRALHIKIYGLENYMINQELVRFIHSEHSIYPDDLKIQVLSKNSPHGVEYLTLPQLYQHKKDLKILILNCQFVHLYSQLRSLLLGGDVRVQQYLHGYKDTAHTISSITSVMSVCFSANYSVGFFDELVQAENRSPFGLSMTDILLCTYYDENNVRCTDIILFVTENLGIMSIRAPYESIQNPFLQSRLGKYYWIKNTPAESNTHIAQIILSHAALANNSHHWSFKPDLFISQVSENILHDAINAELFSRSEFENIKASFSKLACHSHLARHHVFMIHKKRAMNHFAETGTIQSHPHFLKPFSPAQRLEILDSLIREQDSNPYFHLLFLRDDNSVDDMEIRCYDRKGILVIPDSKYDKKYCEVFINNSEFTDAYKKFYMQEMVMKLCLPESASVSILKSLRNQIT